MWFIVTLPSVVLQTVTEKNEEINQLDEIDESETSARTNSVEEGKRGYAKAALASFTSSEHVIWQRWIAICECCNSILAFLFYGAKDAAIMSSCISS
jgi:hypothetical protein